MSFQVQLQSRKVNRVLENPEERAYLMMKISNDEKLRTEMNGYLSNNVEATKQLKAKFGEQKKDKEQPKKEMCPMCKKKMEEKKQKENEEN